MDSAILDAFQTSSLENSMRSKIETVSHKEPIAMLWIIIGCLFMAACMIGIERLVPRY